MSRPTPSRCRSDVDGPAPDMIMTTIFNYGAAKPLLRAAAREDAMTTTPRLCTTFRCALALALTALGASLGCSDDPDPVSPTVDAGRVGDAAGSPGPLYAIASRVMLPSGGVTLVALVDSLAAGPVDTSRTLEIAGF